MKTKVQWGLARAVSVSPSACHEVATREAALRPSRSGLDSNKLGYDVGVRFHIDVLE